MPGWVQGFVKVNPISQLATASRGFMHGDVDMAAVGWTLVWSAALLVVFAPLTMRRYNRA
jgi:ABC-2 type transport system permease protein